MHIFSPEILLLEVYIKEIIRDVQNIYKCKNTNYIIILIATKLQKTVTGNYK